jgi:hypothetical protein
MRSARQLPFPSSLLSIDPWLFRNSAIHYV